MPLFSVVRIRKRAPRARGARIAEPGDRQLAYGSAPDPASGAVAASAAASASAKKACSSGVPAVIRSAPGAPNGGHGRTIAPSPQQRPGTAPAASSPTSTKTKFVTRARPARARPRVSVASRRPRPSRSAARRRVELVLRRRGSRAPPPGRACRRRTPAAPCGSPSITSRRPDAVADPEAGEAVDLRERAQHEHAAAGLRGTPRSRPGSRGRRCTRSTPGRAPSGRARARARSRRRARPARSSSPSGCSGSR